MVLNDYIAVITIIIDQTLSIPRFFVVRLGIHTSVTEFTMLCSSLI